jgi:hypothetical protein
MATAQKSKPSDPRDQVPAIWLAFTEAMRFTFAPGRDRTLDQYLKFKELVHQVVQDEAFGVEFRDRLMELAPEDFGRGIPGERQLNTAIEALLEELRATTRAAELARSATASIDPSKKSWRRWVRPVLEKGAIATGSAKDLAGVTPYLKYGFTIYGELIDMFKKN